MLVIPVVRRLRQEDHELEASLSLHMMRPCLKKESDHNCKHGADHYPPFSPPSTRTSCFLPRVSEPPQSAHLDPVLSPPPLHAPGFPVRDLKNPSGEIHLLLGSAGTRAALGSFCCVARIQQHCGGRRGAPSSHHLY
jgi:hypothetical protein